MLFPSHWLASCRRGRGKLADDPFVAPATDSKGKGKAKETETTKLEVAVVELEYEDEIIEDEQPLSDWQASGLEDGKPFVYQEDLHKRR